ncbi:MAG: threonylcarbamoyl-AMP synthase [Rickettsiales bacterium]|jgi:L-threonylcarbamoyladenylate synthase|nr:threonylcarbamoyl-AMP synthase [Rickettsiales bacterium]
MSDVPLNKTLACLQRGGLVIFPTETVYALACDATSDDAVKAVFRAKGRAEQKPLSVMVPTLDAAEEIAEFSSKARSLAKAYWPGPLTLVVTLKKGHPLSSLVTGGGDSVGIRIPNHAIAQTLLKEFGKPLVATSVNLSGQPPAVSMEEVKAYEKQLFSQDIVVIQGDESPMGMASTVLDVRMTPFQLLRQGALEIIL